MLTHICPYELSHLLERERERERDRERERERERERQRERERERERDVVTHAKQSLSLSLSDLIESSQQDGADHAGHLKPQTGQESSTFQSNVRGPNDQGLPRRRLHGENVVT